MFYVRSKIKKLDLTFLQFTDFFLYTPPQPYPEVATPKKFNFGRTDARHIRLYGNRHPTGRMIFAQSPCCHIYHSYLRKILCLLQRLVFYLLRFSNPLVINCCRCRCLNHIGHFKFSLIDLETLTSRRGQQGASESSLRD